MIPLGVVAYSGASESPPHAEFPFSRKKFKHKAKSRLAQPGRAVEDSPRPSDISTADSHSSSVTESADSRTALINKAPKPHFRLLSQFTLPRRATQNQKLKPKHAPIVVPQLVQPEENQASPSTSIDDSSIQTPPDETGNENISLSDFPIPGRKLSIAESVSEANSPHLRPRHVEIKVPSWAPSQCKYTLFPRSTTNTPSPNAKRVTFATSPQSASSYAWSERKMARQLPQGSRTSTLDSSISAPSPAQLASERFRASSVNSSQTSLSRLNSQQSNLASASSEYGPVMDYQQTGPSPGASQTAGLSTQSNSGLSGLVCNVHRTTGKEPKPLVGATTTVVGDKLYVFGGRKLSRTRPQLTADLYELDLIKRHWTKLEVSGEIPPPRYFHSVCALGDQHLVCYGGMSPAVLPNGQPTVANQPMNPSEPQPEVVVMSDIHIYNIPTRTWMRLPAIDSPQGRYAHCACMLPSSAIYTSADAPMSSIQHNASSLDQPNSGQLGITLDGTGSAEMVVVGGQDSANHYIEQISVFNIRSQKWTSTTILGRSCGAYRSVTAPISSSLAASIGAGRNSTADGDKNDSPPDMGSAMLIYSNYNFLDVKLELQVRMPDGSLVEKPMQTSPSPPGLRFPNGGIIDNHFVVSGTFLTSSKQEYALWALDMRTLTWTRVDAGGSTFTQGSWNRGVLWNRRNTFVILGNRKRSLVEDYNHRRINFTNICMVELEAFGLYDNPRRTKPTSGFVSASSPLKGSNQMTEPLAGGRQLSAAAEELGQMALGLHELCDMEFLAMNGERIPANSQLVANRWGPYFNQLLRESMNAEINADTATLRPSVTGLASRNSSITITPSVGTGYSNATTLLNSEAGAGSAQERRPSMANPSTRPRTLYLPHTPLTIQALLRYLYTSSLPPPTSPLCTPQILCSLLQLARPYHIDGLLEAVVERLHKVLDGRNTAAIFNAAAMAAGGGDGVRFFNPALNGSDKAVNGNGGNTSDNSDVDPADGAAALRLGSDPDVDRPRPLRINTNVNRPSTSMSQSAESASGTSATSEDESSSAGGAAPTVSSGRILAGSTAGASDVASSRGDAMAGQVEPWTGEISSVIGLQKRGLRGLMEGRRIRELVRDGGPGGADGGAGGGGSGRVGLGIA
jgi:Galactose oxidase, central domain